MKVGDLIRHDGKWRDAFDGIGIVLYDNDEGGTLKILDQDSGKVFWIVKSECEVINESWRLS
jgi:hypothetical protein